VINKSLVGITMQLINIVIHINIPVVVSIDFSSNKFLVFFLSIDGNANSFETEQNCREICQAKEKGLFKKIIFF
jgi:hypothetical protein